MNKTITTREMDELASRFWGWQGLLSETEEQAFICAAYKDGQLDIHMVPNRHPNPSAHVRILLSDVQVYLDCGLQLIGFLHTHLPGGLDAPSDDDYVGLHPGYIGGVHMLGTETIHWHDKYRMLHTSKIALRTD